VLTKCRERLLKLKIKHKPSATNSHNDYSKTEAGAGQTLFEDVKYLYTMELKFGQYGQHGIAFYGKVYTDAEGVCRSVGQSLTGSHSAKVCVGHLSTRTKNVRRSGIC
jgi:hypothetical protein